VISAISINFTVVFDNLVKNSMTRLTIPNGNRILNNGLPDGEELLHAILSSNQIAVSLLDKNQSRRVQEKLYRPADCRWRRVDRKIKGQGRLS
jgi:hypothetical protein